jgi:hypothetical protein
MSGRMPLAEKKEPKAFKIENERKNNLLQQIMDKKKRDNSNNKLEVDQV